MKKIISLTKVLFKINKNNVEAKRKKSKVFIALGLGVYILIVFVNFWRLFIDPLKSVGRPELAVSLILNLSSIFIFMTSITYVANILYFTNDMENILPFPFKPKEIFAAKLLTVYLYQLFVVLMFLIPGFIAYGSVMGLGAVFYIYAMLVSLMIPIIPILLVTIFYSILVQFLKFSKYKNFLKILFSVLLLGIVVIFEVNLNNNMAQNGGYDPKYILEMTENMNANTPYFLDTAINSLNVENMFLASTSLVWYMLINLLSIIITVCLFDKLYINGVFISFGGVAIKTRKTRHERRWKKKHQIVALVNREIKNLFRNVTYFIQCVIPIFLMPIVFFALSTTSLDESVTKLIYENSVMKIIIGLVIIEFYMLMNNISATAISRDGNDEASFFKTLPVSIKTLINAKAAPSILLGIINLIIVLVYLCINVGFNLLEIVSLFISGVLLNFIQSYLYLILDLKSPKLFWESEIAVVKQNMNIFKAILIWIAVIILTVLFGSLLFEYNELYFVISYNAVLVGGFLIVKRYIRKNAAKLYEKIR